MDPQYNRPVDDNTGTMRHPVSTCNDPPRVPRRCCSWATCQKPNAPEYALCDEHVALSKVLGLKVWPA
jgi:hypothetical protein